jgi:putative Mg2+ transporter-C (MgtC) family protein
MIPTDDAVSREIVMRLAAAALIGFMLGVDRDLHRKPAGIRVLSLVSIGACSVTMLGWLVVSKAAAPVDFISHIVQGILQGIGFLGAGVIMHLNGNTEVHGITTAASIWLCAILGMCCGMGEWFLSVTTFVAAWLILLVGGMIERSILQRKHGNSQRHGDVD